jgi:hypothetical protein
MTLQATFTANLNMIQSGANAFADRLSDDVAFSQKLTDGTGAGNADLLYVAERTVATATDDDIDLAGVLSDVFGTTLTFAELVGILIINKQKDGTANTTDLTIGGGSNPFVGFLGGTTPTVGPIKPGGMFMLMSPDAAGIGTVTAGTGDILRITNSAGASNTYQIAIVGRSA